MSEDHHGIQLQKSRIRAKARLQREALTIAARRGANQRIQDACFAHPTVAQAETVFVYVSTDMEVETHALIDAFEAAGQATLVPFILDRHTMLAVRFPGWQAMQPGALGILSPPPTAAYPGPVAVALVPGLAFTPNGKRVGYGGGYYDRWLAAHPHTTAIALAFDAQIVGDLPAGRDDVAVNSVITESRCLEIELNS